MSDLYACICASVRSVSIGFFNIARIMSGLLATKDLKVANVSNLS